MAIVAVVAFVVAVEPFGVAVVAFFVSDLVAVYVAGNVVIDGGSRSEMVAITATDCVKVGGVAG